MTARAIKLIKKKDVGKRGANHRLALSEREAYEKLRRRILSARGQEDSVLREILKTIENLDQRVSAMEGR